MNNADTIFALSSGAGKSGVAVIRISGAALESEFSRIINLTGFITPRHAYLTNMTDDAGALIDQCVAIYFAAPASFTGEDVIEIHCHGAQAVIQKIFETLTRRGMRMATPGEFSRRAFYNNKMDLAAVDGLAALLDARTDRQRTFALKSLTGSDGKVYESWRAKMIEISAYAAAILDHASDDLPDNIGKKLIHATQILHGDIHAALLSYKNSHVIRSGFNIVLTGDTNVGKSSLFNRMVGESRAIVSDIHGTTRDVITATLDIDGYLVNLSDTAGIRDSDDTIEKIGIERTHATVRDADLVIRVQSAECKVQFPEQKNNEIIVINKADLISDNCTLHSALCTLASAITGVGIDELMAKIKQKIHDQLDGMESDVVVNERTRTLLMDAADELHNALKFKVQSSKFNKEQIAQSHQNSENTQPWPQLNSELCTLNFDIFAEHVRRAADAIGKILGVINASEVMDATFGQLCLGK